MGDYEDTNQDYKNERITQNDLIGEINDIGKTVGNAAGIVGGAYTGALTGTTICTGLGFAIGGPVGATIGYSIGLMGGGGGGAIAGKKFSDAVIKAIEDDTPSLKVSFKGASRTISHHKSSSRPNYIGAAKKGIEKTNGVINKVREIKHNNRQKER